MKTNTTQLARLRIIPSFGPPNTLQALLLVREDDNYWLKETTQEGSQTRKHRRILVSSHEAEQHLAALRKASIPLYPVSPPTLDGTHFELTIYGEAAELRLSWWTIAPDGAETADRFTTWLCNAAEENGIEI